MLIRTMLSVLVVSLIPHLQPLSITSLNYDIGINTRKDIHIRQIIWSVLEVLPQTTITPVVYNREKSI